MAAVSELAVPLDSTEYACWSDLRRALNDWAVKDKFSFRTPKKEPNLATFACATVGCPWKCRVRRNREGLLVLSIVESTHQCLSAGVGKFRAASSAAWLDEVVSRHLCVTKATPPKAVIDCLRVRFGEEVSYKVAQLCRLRLLNGSIGAQRYSFQLLPAYRQRLEASAPDVYLDLAIDPVSQNFGRLFVCPAQSRASFRLCRRFLAVDGTFLKARFILTLLLAVGIDPDGRNLLLAWGVVESENRDSWEWFFRHLRRAIPEVSTEACTLVSDRDKGLLEAEQVLGNRVTRAYCCRHLKENFTKHFGQGLSALFWQAARARTPAAFEAALVKIGEVKKKAEEYLRNVDPQLWAESHFPSRRYGHDTSNIVESLNNILKLDRELNIIELLDTIWHRTMELRSQRYTEALQAITTGVQYTSFVTTAVQEGRKWAQSNRVSRFPIYSMLY